MAFSWNPISIPLRIVVAAKEYCVPEWYWVHPGVNVTRFNLWLVDQGKGSMRFEHSEQSLCAGDCLLLRQWQPNVGSHDPKQTLVVPYVVFDLLDHQGRAAAIPAEHLLPPLHRRIDPMGFFATLVQRCIDAHEAGDAPAAVAWLRASLMELARQDALPAPESFQHEQMSRIETMCEEIRRNPAAALRCEELANEAGYSVDHFIRLFKSFKGITPGEFILQTRLQAAGQMLRFSRLSVTQIAEQLGYSDIYAFSKQFHQRMGMTPSAFRKSTSLK